MGPPKKGKKTMMTMMKIILMIMLTMMIIMGIKIALTIYMENFYLCFKKSNLRS